MEGKVVKRYSCQNRMISIVSSQYGYTFCIDDKARQKRYISTPYESVHECENESYKTAKNIGKKGMKIYEC